MQDQIIISQLLEQINLLVGEVRVLRAEVSNIHRIFSNVPATPVKRLSPKQQRAKDLKDEIEQERIMMLKELNQN